MKEINTVICGGDRRMLSAAALFSKIGKCFLWRCASGEVPGAQRTDNIREDGKNAFIILPIPAFDKNGMVNGAGHINAEELFRLLPGKSTVFGGKIPPVISRLAAEHGHTLLDYGEREDFNLLNAVPTAEAAILIAMEHMKTTIHKGSFTVIGYGRIGKALSARLSDLGGKVTVAARSESALASAECDGHTPIHINSLFEKEQSWDVCFNTVPVPIFDNEMIKYMNCPLFIELASLPGGFSSECKSYLGDRYISALSLPGRYFPVSAGEIIYKTVLTMIRSRVTI